MARLLPSYLRTLRLSASLSQKELGLLLDVSEDVISNCERGYSSPTSQLLLGAMYLFGVPAEDVFPGYHKRVWERIGRGAVACDKRWRGRTDTEGLKKLSFLKKVSDASPDNL